MLAPGIVVVLNGAPRSGKTALATALQGQWDGPLLALGVDALGAMTPAAYRPGLGLRPGGERPDLEPLVAALLPGLYGAVAAFSRAGVAVVVDIGQHDAYRRPFGGLALAADLLAGLPAYRVGVRCPLPEILRRRAAAPAGAYVTVGPNGDVPDPVRRWEAVHEPPVYDIEVDTSLLSPPEAALVVRERIAAGPGTAWPSLRSAKSSDGTDAAD